MSDCNKVKAYLAKLDSGKYPVKSFTAKYIAHQINVNPIIVKQILDSNLEKFEIMWYYSIIDVDDVGTNVQVTNVDNIDLGNEFENPLTGEMFELFDDSQITEHYLFKKYFDKNEFHK